MKAPRTAKAKFLMRQIGALRLRLMVSKADKSPDRSYTISKEESGLDYPVIIRTIRI